MKKLFPSDEQERFMVRMPEGMRDRIAEAAKTSGRSMNAEIVHCLDKAFGASQDEEDAPESRDLQGMLLLTRLDLASVAAAVDALKHQLPQDSPDVRLLSLVAKRYRLPKEVVDEMEQEHLSKQSAFMRQLIEKLHRLTPGTD